MRKLTEQELLKLADEIKEKDIWQEYVNFALKYCPNAHKIDADFSSEYNDEGGYYQMIEHLSIKDKNGQELEFEEHPDYNEDEKYELPTTNNYGFTFTINEPPKLSFPEVFVKE